MQVLFAGAVSRCECWHVTVAGESESAGGCDWPHVNTTAYSRASAAVGLLETRLKPREVLYCPPVWFHGTEAIGPGPNLGLSFWSESGECLRHWISE